MDVLTAVCSRWRQLFLNSPQLWTLVCISLYPNQPETVRSVNKVSVAHRYVKNSRLLPLHIRLFCPPAEIIHNSFANDVLNVLLQASDRWESSILHVWERDIQSLPSSFPLLKKLYLHTWQPDIWFPRSSEQVNVNDVSMPQLSALHLFMGVSEFPLIVTQKLSLQVLTSLEVSSVVPEGVRALFELLNSCRLTLRELRMSKIRSWSPVTNALIFPFLKTLTMRDMDRKCSKGMFNMLTTPRLLALEFIGCRFLSDATRWPSDLQRVHERGFPNSRAVKRFIDRSKLSSSLRLLTIIDADIGPSQIQDALQHLPLISSLRLMLTSDSPVFAFLMRGQNDSIPHPLSHLRAFTYVPKPGRVVNDENRLLEMVRSRLVEGGPPFRLDVIQVCICLRAQPLYNTPTGEGFFRCGNVKHCQCANLDAEITERFTELLEQGLHLSVR
ncbi:hypothetical protein V5O48_014988 [Marasmius crinis-equi]|uniref:F-box domain-containing protein n=1 Tax=Marasmius crinis-equi TaxID=585013 RepID=A0ABR3EVT8_9AGAR